MSTRSLVYLKLLSGVIAISFSAILVKWAGVDPTLSAFFRTLYAAGFLFALSGIKRNTEFQTNNHQWILPSLLAGVFFAADLIIWHKTIFYIGAGPATVLGNSQVVFVTILVYLFFKEKFHPMFWLLLPLIFLGLYMAIPKTNILVDPTKGFFMGLMVGLTYAGFLLCMRYAHMRTKSNYPEILSLALIMVVSAVLIGGYGAWIENISFTGISIKSHGILLLLAIVAQSLGWILIKSNLTKMPAHQGSLLLLLQPLLTTIWGCLFFREPMGSLQFIGIAMSIGLIALYQTYFAKRIKP
jgi:drug/metabolite transporter (DMT)-like permease